MAQSKLKSDKFRKNRGNYSRLLDIFCRKCNNLALVYQKDGPGNLRRLYFDRIFSPKNMNELQNKKLKKTNALKCKNCGEILGTRHTYEKEHREAYRLYQDAVTKKIRKLKAD